MSEQEQFKDVDYCRKEILEIRRYIGEITATERTFKAAYTTLGLMLLHCPADFVDTVHAQIAETETRYRYAMMLPGFFNKDE